MLCSCDDSPASFVVLCAVLVLAAAAAVAVPPPPFDEPLDTPVPDVVFEPYNYEYDRSRRVFV